MSHSARIRRRRQGAHHPGRWIALVVLVVLLCGASIAAAGVTWVLRTANSAHALSTYTPRNPGSLTEVFASDGKTRLGWIQNDDLVRPVPSSSFPDVLKQATVAIEDERFYKHKGVDYEGIIRAAVKNATAKGKAVQGGSTLTMQLVRLLYTQDDTRDGIAGYQRKIKEAKLARDLEEQYSKKWVVGKYLNTVPYGTVGGQTAIGAEAASRLYFNKPAKDLTLRQAAMLAGMPQAPSQYSPVNNESGTIQRRNEVLGKMAELGYITREKAQTEMKKGLGLNMKKYFQRARERYVLDYVKSELIKEYGIDTVRRGGFRVYTTIDLKKQKEARAAIEERMGNVGPSSAIATINPRNGDILAMASSQEYGKSKYNLAAQGKRQPGSAFKTMVLMTALRLGVNPNSTTYSSRGNMKLDDPPCGSPASPWDVKTYSGKGGGSKNLVSATLASDNVIYAQLTADLGPDKVKETARMMGIKSELQRLLRRVARRPRARRLAARDGQRLRDDRQRRLPQPAARDQEDRPGRQDAQAAEALAREAHEGLLGRRDLRGGQDPRAEHDRRHRRPRRHRLPGRRQDGHDRQEHRRLVRRLHPAAVDRGLGRLPRRRPALDERHVRPDRRQHRRRHLPG